MLQLRIAALACSATFAQPVRVTYHRAHSPHAEKVFQRLQPDVPLSCRRFTVQPVRASALAFRLAVQSKDSIRRALVEIEYTVDIRSDPPARAVRSIFVVVSLADGQLALSDLIAVPLENVSGIKLWPLPDESATEFWNAETKGAQRWKP